MEKDDKKTVQLVCPTINISAETRKKLLQAISHFVATTDELTTETILPLEECLRRLHKMEDVKKPDLKEDKKKIELLKTEPNKPTWPTLVPISQATISKLKAACLNVAYVKPTLPSKRTMPPASITNKKRRKMMRRRTLPIPLLGRPFPKRNTIASSNKTIRKSCSDIFEAAGKGSMIAMLEDLSVSEDSQIDFGDTYKVKNEPLDSTIC